MIQVVLFRDVKSSTTQEATHDYHVIDRQFVFIFFFKIYVVILGQIFRLQVSFNNLDIFFIHGNLFIIKKNCMLAQMQTRRARARRTEALIRHTDRCAMQNQGGQSTSSKLVHSCHTSIAPSQVHQQEHRAIARKTEHYVRRGTVAPHQHHPNASF